MTDELAPTPGESGMDYAEHENTYKMFVGLVKWGLIAVVAVLIVMAVTLG